MTILSIYSLFIYYSSLCRKWSFYALNDRQARKNIHKQNRLLSSTNETRYGEPESTGRQPHSPPTKGR